jgi:hypothetical protein
VSGQAAQLLLELAERRLDVEILDHRRRIGGHPVHPEAKAID